MRAIALALALAAAIAVAQTCIVAAPAAPPVPRQLLITLPADGGSQGCTVRALGVSNAVQASDYAVGNAKCATAVAIAQQAAAIDNGWADGGAP